MSASSSTTDENYAVLSRRTRNASTVEKPLPVPKGKLNRMLKRKCWSLWLKLLLHAINFNPEILLTTQLPIPQPLVFHFQTSRKRQGKRITQVWEMQYYAKVSQLEYAKLPIFTVDIRPQKRGQEGQMSKFS